MSPEKYHVSETGRVITFTAENSSQHALAVGTINTPAAQELVRRGNLFDRLVAAVKHWELTLNDDGTRRRLEALIKECEQR